MTTQSEFTVSMIGSGNVATHLSKMLAQKRVKVDCVYSRDVEHASRLAVLVGADSKSVEGQIKCGSKVVIIAVADDAIGEVVNRLEVADDDTIVLHTSGSVGMESFVGRVKRYGVMYPLQTFSRTKELNFETVPLFVEAVDAATLTDVWRLAEMLSGKNVYHVDSSRRLKIHIAAVFACNFTNAMYAIAADILREEELSFDILKPLIRQTADKVLAVDNPRAVQTGPAVRRDGKVIAKHLDMLTQKPDYRELYELISKIIADAKTE